MKELPKGWSLATIDQIAHINPRHPRSLPDTLPVTFVRMSAISGETWTFEFTEERLLGEVRKGFTHFAEADVLFAKITPCMENGKAAVASNLTNGIGCGTTELHVLRPLDGIDSKFIYYYLHRDSFREEAARNFTGTAGQLRVPVSFIKDAQIPLPPLNEQRRIVAKLEKLLSRVNAAQERLATIPRILKRFRQSVLAAACSGQLTISSSERRNREREHVTLKQITADLITGPFGSALHKADYVSNGIPVVNPMNMVNGIIVPSEKMTVDARTREKLGRYVLREGDIVLARRGEMGRCALVTSNESGWLCGTGSAILRLNDTASPKYVKMHISSPLVREYLSEGAVGSTMANLNQNLFYAMPIELPGIDEQKEIVRRVEALFQTADALEARYLKAKAHVDKLTQSILAKAFRGELVPQDPTDEPTADLAKRIGAVKMKAKGSAIRFEITPAIKGENSRVKR